jgi:ATP-dependent Clp protease protease subunit|tara:strand:+ start:565 stop:1212 length:648 start_codon:yes stop_codon:yes gene_type:complete
LKFSEEEKEEKKEETTPIILLNTSSEQPKLRSVKLFGSLSEDKVEEIACTLLELQKTGIEEVLEDPTNPDSPVAETIYKPVDFYISTWGGCAYGMFTLYDVIREMRENYDICTYGLGKVMSAGVLLLASGTKGKRKIGKSCRVMIHSTVGEQWGALHNLENEMNEMRWIQEQLCTTLIKETKLTRRQLKKMLDKRVNFYFTAKEAVEYGIADIIV